MLIVIVIGNTFEATRDQDVSLRRETDYHEEEVGRNVHQVEEDDLHSVQIVFLYLMDVMSNLFLMIVCFSSQ